MYESTKTTNYITHGLYDFLTLFLHSMLTRGGSHVGLQNDSHNLKFRLKGEFVRQRRSGAAATYVKTFTYSAHKTTTYTI